MIAGGLEVLRSLAAAIYEGCIVHSRESFPMRWKVVRLPSRQPLRMMLALEQNMPESSPIRSHMQMRRDVPPPDPPRPPEEAVLLRIFIGEDDRYKRLPLYEAIVLKAREMHLAGATVLRGFLGFGKSSHMHTEKILRLSMDLPMVIEIVDTLEKVNAFLPYLEPMMRGGLVTLERARVIRFKHEAAPNRIGH